MQTTQQTHVGTWLAWGLILAGVTLVLWQVIQPAPDTAEVVVPIPHTVLAAESSDTSLPTVHPANVVYISGAVVRPGVYNAPDDARIADVVLLAGGLRSDADMVAINLATPVNDGMHVHVVSIGASTPAPESLHTADTVLDVNTATAQMLADLPGIGPALAERIVAYRDAHGDFHSMEDLGAVPGIGPALQTKLAPLVRFTPDG